MTKITVQHLVMCSDICVHRIRRSRDIAELRAPASPKIQRSLLLLLGANPSWVLFFIFLSSRLVPVMFLEEYHIVIVNITQDLWTEHPHKT